VIARSLAFLCLANADLRDKDLATQAVFLEALGLPRHDAAELLKSSEKSLSELIRRSKRGKRGKVGKTKKAKR
jgi:hypothetical protein